FEQLLRRRARLLQAAKRLPQKRGELVEALLESRDRFALARGGRRLAHCASFVIEVFVVKTVAIYSISGMRRWLSWRAPSSSMPSSSAACCCRRSCGSWARAHGPCPAGWNTACAESRSTETWPPGRRSRSEREQAHQSRERLSSPGPQRKE